MPDARASNEVSMYFIEPLTNALREHQIQLKPEIKKSNYAILKNDIDRQQR